MYTLTRISDSLVKESKEILFVSFDKYGGFDDSTPEPKIGTSLLMSPFNPFSYTWLTTTITEILENTETTLHFKTTNSEYILKKQL